MNAIVNAQSTVSNAANQTPATPSVENTMLLKNKLINIKTIMEYTGLSHSSIYDMLNPKCPRHDPSFPKQVQITANRVGWVAAEVDAWIEGRIAVRDAL